MAEGYSEGLTLDRIDNNLGYSKENCRWVKAVFQARNRGLRTSSTSGVTGVSYDKSKNAWVAYSTQLDGGRRFKSFSIKKYGNEAAKELAIEHRAKQIKELNELGAGYAASHGDD